METPEILKSLTQGGYYVVRDYWKTGLEILNFLKKTLKRKYPSKNFQEQRNYRSAYRDASHRLLLRIVDRKLRVRKSPNIGWLETLYPDQNEFYMSFPDIQGLNSSWQWYLKGIEISRLNLKIHPYVGVYFPTRFEHVELFEDWLVKYQGRKITGIDVGVGCGVLSFQLLLNGFEKVIGTDVNMNAIIGTSEDSDRLEFSKQLFLKHCDLLSEVEDHADLIVFNPPWLLAKHPIKTGIDRAIYYEQDLFPRFFEQAKRHLKPEGRLVMLFSNLAKVVDGPDLHPILEELTQNNRFVKEDYQERRVRPSSKKTRRRNWRKQEKVELWVLGHS